MSQMIVLWGYMGCGKSTVGKALAQHLTYPLVDLDLLIESEQKLSIAEIFDQMGSIKFRQMERQTLEGLLQRPDSLILSLGGGTPCYFDQAKRLVEHPNTQVFYLKYTPKYLSDRLFEERDQRPLIAHLDQKEALEEFVAKHLFERQQFYDQATHTLLCDHKSVAEIVSEIQQSLV